MDRDYAVRVNGLRGPPGRDLGGPSPLCQNRSMRRRVVVTGMGAVSALGSTLEETWRGLLAGACGIRPLSLFDASAYRTQTAAEVGAIPDGFLTAAERRRMSRADRMGVAAAREALAASGIDPSREDPTRLGVILGGG